MLRNVLESIPGCKVVGKASNGREALEVIQKHQPDLITLDVQMPELNGIETLRELKTQNATCQAIMVSRLTEAGASATADALLEGAFDFILKPSGKSPEANQAALKSALEEKISAFRASHHVRRTAPSRSKPVSRPGAGRSSAVRQPVEQRQTVEAEPDEATADDDVSSPSPHKSDVRAVVIGTSTGGPETLKRILPSLSENLSVPVVIVQHMPRGYTSSLARSLDTVCPLEIREAEQGDELKPGTILIAPGGHHLKLVRNAAGRVSVTLTDDPPEHGCRPSVDYALRGAVEAYDGRLLAVILTGMGRDGTDGCRLARERGARIVAQHEEGCVVYGMPKSVIDNKLAHRVSRLSSIAAVINREARHS